MNKTRVKRQRFTYADDIILLKEFLIHNPLKNAEKWSIVQENLQKTQREDSFNKNIEKSHTAFN